MIKKYLDDLLLVGGCGCILTGIAQLSIPAMWITGGLMLIGFGVMVGKIKGKL